MEQQIDQSLSLSLSLPPFSLNNPWFKTIPSTAPATLAAVPDSSYACGHLTHRILSQGLPRKQASTTSNWMSALKTKFCVFLLGGFRAGCSPWKRFRISILSSVECASLPVFSHLQIAGGGGVSGAKLYAFNIQFLFMAKSQKRERVFIPKAKNQGMRSREYFCSRSLCWSRWRRWPT